MTKKLCSACLMLLMVFSFASCQSGNGEGTASTAQPTQVTQTEAASTETEPESETTRSTEKTAVVYFSATGNTGKAAQLLAEETGGDLFEIQPKDPYTEADLDYNQDDCRANREQQDTAARPEIGNDLSAVESYDVLYLGYPIWWGTHPRIIETFLDSYDLSGAQVYTFCTSGGSTIEKSVGELQSMYAKLHIVEGKRLNGASGEDIRTWLDERH